MKQCPQCHGTYPDAYLTCPLDQSPLSSSPSALHVGSIIRGRYQVLSELGHGGMATVYKVRHTHFREEFALKIVHPEFMQDPAFLKRFRNEAIIVRQLNHPNAVKVFDLDHAEDGRPFILMELVDGRTILDARRLNPYPWPAPACIDIASQVADALVTAHSRGIVHRDIKPSNIVLLDFPGKTSLKVMDFGIAKVNGAALVGLTSVLTEHNLMIGTPLYMSPEQVSGPGDAEIDGRSDLYSLGVLLYEIATGVHPFKADTPMAIALQHLHTQPTPPRTFRPDLPAPLSVLILKCLEKNRDNRFQSASELLQALTAVRGTLDDEPLNTLPQSTATSSLSTLLGPTGSLWQTPHPPESTQPNPPPPSQPSTPKRPTPWKPLSIAAAVLTLAAAATGWLILAPPAQKASTAAPPFYAPYPTPTPRISAPAPAPATTRPSYRPAPAIAPPSSALPSPAARSTAAPSTSHPAVALSKPLPPLSSQPLPPTPSTVPDQYKPPATVPQPAAPTITTPQPAATPIEQPRTTDPDEAVFRQNATPEMLDVYTHASEDRRRIMRDHAIATSRRRLQGNASVIDIIPPTLSSAGIFKAITTDLRLLDAYETSSSEQQHAMRVQAVLHFTEQRLGTPLTPEEESRISQRVR